MHLVTISPEDIFQALSDPIRIRILRILISSGEESCQCELADSFLEPEYKLSRHLKVLRQSGLLTATKEGRWVYHRLVTTGAFLKQLHATIRNIPDTDKQFQKDLKRFKQRMALRDNGRCKTQPVAHLVKRRSGVSRQVKIKGQ